MTTGAHTRRVAGVPSLPALVSAAPAFAQAARTAKIDAADTAWMITATALVLMMTLPGLALFYSGMVRKKNVLATMAQTPRRGCCWSRSCGSSSATASPSPATAPVIGTLDRVFLNGIGDGLDQPAGEDHPGSAVHALPDDLRGHHGGAGRRARSPTACGSRPSCWFCALLAAGGLCAARALGVGRRLPRRRTACSISPAVWWCISMPASRASSLPACSASAAAMARDNLAPYDLSLAVIGTGLLWVGWFGFNGGSALGAGSRAVMAITSTHLAACAGALTWMALEWCDARQAVGARHDLRRGRGPRHHHAGLRLRAADGTASSSASSAGAVCYWACTWLKQQARLRRLARRVRRARRRRR